MKSRKPPWIRVRLPGGEAYNQLKELKGKKSLHTVCEEALCPNLAECWAGGQSTFMILGDICTRNCRFCGVAKGKPNPPDADEPRRLAEAIGQMNLRHAVVTSVTRDDLPDGGAAMFASVITEIRRRNPECSIEVLIPDFEGKKSSLDLVLTAAPHVLGHNVETVPRLYPLVRPGAEYERSLEVIRRAKEDGGLLTKSGFMVGLGETEEDLLRVMLDLRGIGCDILTIGQYLRPTPEHLPVTRYYPPEEFIELKKVGLDMGFPWVESGPLVRSSYRAEAQAKALLRGTSNQWSVSSNQ
jgi:lipoic acid synthetase